MLTIEPAAWLDHRRRDGLHPEEHADLVDVDDSPVHLQVGVEQLGPLEDAGVVDQYVDATVALDGLAHDLGPLLLGRARRGR